MRPQPMSAISTATTASNAGVYLRAIFGRNEWAFTSTDVQASANFVCKPIVNKGIGCCAVRAISRGEMVLSETPLVHWRLRAGESVTHRGIDTQISSLSTADQMAFWALCQNAEYGDVKSAYGIWLSNAYPTDGTNLGRRVEGALAERSSAVFCNLCRLNHDCHPNLHCAWNSMLGKQTVFALRDISEGEELTVSYLGDLEQTRAERQASLSADFDKMTITKAPEVDKDTEL